MYRQMCKNNVQLLNRVTKIQKGLARCYIIFKGSQMPDQITVVNKTLTHNR